jgi:hypothetical protein
VVPLTAVRLRRIGYGGDLMSGANVFLVVWYMALFAGIVGILVLWEMF